MNQTNKTNTIKATTKLKIIVVLAVITMLVLANTEVGAVKLICWLGLFVETAVMGLVFEKEFGC